MKKAKNYILAFGIPFVICLIFFFLKGVFLDIEGLYVSDLRLQHIVFLSYLKRKQKPSITEWIFLSWKQDVLKEKKTCNISVCYL